MTAPHPAPYAVLAQAWRDLAARGGCVLTETSVGEPARLMLSAEIPNPGAPRVCISAGAHGDEPVPAWALLELARGGELDPRFAYRLFCCTNPTGYERGTRRNIEDVDINRSFTVPPATPEAAHLAGVMRGERYALLLDLHEDFEAEGVYLYEPIVEGTTPYGERILAAAQAAGYARQTFAPDFDLGYPQENADHLRTLRPGHVLPHVANECSHFADRLPITMFALEAGIAHRTMTIESPRTIPWDDRVVIHRIAVTCALRAYAEDARLGT